MNIWSLNQNEEDIVASLSEDFIQRIDERLLSHTKESWQKVAMIVGLTMTDSTIRIKGLPDIYYAQRISRLVEKGFLESLGDLNQMHFSEIRLPIFK
jgi:hypothetical protein